MKTIYRWGIPRGWKYRLVETDDGDFLIQVARVAVTLRAAPEDAEPHWRDSGTPKPVVREFARVVLAARL